jgi:hypothetical protein
LYKRKLGHKVTPLKTIDIHTKAHKVRDVLMVLIEGLNIKKHKLPIIDVYDHLMDNGLMTYEVVEDNVLGERLAETFPDKEHITVFDGACDGVPFHRFTLAHELGHLFLHKNQAPKSYARGEVKNHKVYEDSEWQADEFASELLIDKRDLTGNETAVDLTARYGISLLAAETKLRKLEKNRN